MSKLPIVCDNGTGFVKAGYANAHFPEHIFPSMIGKPLMRFDEEFKDIELKDIMVGDECAKYRSMLDISFPVSEGQVSDWKGMCHLWDYTFHDRLKIDPSDHKILLTEPPSNNKENQKMMMRNMFEKYGFSHAKVQIQAMLVLYAQGLITGVVIDSGDGVSHIVPVFDGVTPPNLIQRMNVAGRHITSHLIKLLQVRGYAFNSSADFETVRQIKEKLCYCAYDVKDEMKLALETTVLIEKYTLPDGRDISIGQERFLAPELLFDPSSLENIDDGEGIHHKVMKMIMAADVDLRKPFLEHIVLSGGSTMYAGLPTRLEKEIMAQYCQQICGGDMRQARKMKLRIEDPPRRKHLVFAGGAVLAGIMKDRDEFWVSKKEWEEEGERILLKKP